MNRRLRAAVACIFLAVAGLSIAPGPAPATAGFTLSRLAGGDRYATAATVATATFGSASEAIVASGENFPDALAGNYLAGQRSAPVLLARRDDVPASTLAALDDLGVQRVTLLGGEGALGSTVAAALEGAGYTVARVAGADRFESAAAIARAGGAPASGTALLASGRSFPDALAAGPIAYRSHVPQLLTEPGSLPPATAAAIADLGIDSVVILGGTGVVSPSIEALLTAGGITVRRVAGADRYATSVAIAEYAVGVLGHGDSHVDVATGGNFPDALAGGAHAGDANGTILLAEPAPAGGAAAGYLAAHADDVVAGHVFGGTGAVADAALAVLVAAGTGGGGGGGGGGGSGDAVSACESELFALLNGLRASNGRPALLHSPPAGSIARGWSEHMAATQALAHNPTLAAQLDDAGIAWSAWAENVTVGGDVADAHSHFTASGTHTGNILGDYTHGAVGCAFDGSGAVWVTETFYRL